MTNVEWLRMFMWDIQNLTRFIQINLLPFISDPLKFWLPMFSMMLIQNPKIGTVPKKFEKCWWTTNHPTTSFWNRKSFLFKWCPQIQYLNCINKARSENFYILFSGNRDISKNAFKVLQQHVQLIVRKNL